MRKSIIIITDSAMILVLFIMAFTKQAYASPNALYDAKWEYHMTQSVEAGITYIASLIPIAWKDIDASGIMDLTDGYTTLYGGGKIIMPKFLLDTFVISTPKQIEWYYDQEAYSGQFRIPYNNDTILATIDNELHGVSIDFDVESDGTFDESLSYKWPDFYALLDNPFNTETQNWQSVAVLTFMLRRSLANFVRILVEDEVLLLYQNFADLERRRVKCIPCDVFPKTGKRGRMILKWFDINKSGKIDTGDSFRILLRNCWLDNPDTKTDFVSSGIVTFYDWNLDDAPNKFSLNVYNNIEINRETIKQPDENYTTSNLLETNIIIGGYHFDLSMIE